MATAPLPPNQPESSTAQQPAPLSQVERIINTFIAPSKTFTDLRRSASWWLPFLLICIVSLGFIYVVDKQIGFRKVTENQIHMSPKQERQLEGKPADQREQQINMRMVGTRYASYGTPLIILFFTLIWTALLFATFKLGASADLKFKTTFAVMIYAGLPGMLKFLLAIVSISAGAAPDAFNINNPVATNLGYILGPEQIGTFLAGIATGLDVFTIWGLVLTAIGLSCISNLKRSTAMYGVFGWYVVMIAFFSGLGAAFS
jgi:Yip1 domain